MATAQPTSGTGSQSLSKGTKDVKSTQLLSQTDLMVQDMRDNVATMLGTWKSKDDRAKKKLQQQLGTTLDNMHKLLSIVHANLQVEASLLCV